MIVRGGAFWVRRWFDRQGICDMLRLALVIYILAGVTLAGIFMIAALTAGYDTLNPILIAVAAGAIAAMPISWMVARALSSDT